MLTTRKITNKKAVVKLTATFTELVYLVEEGTLDTLRSSNGILPT